MHLVKWKLLFKGLLLWFPNLTGSRHPWAYSSLLSHALPSWISQGGIHIFRDLVRPKKVVPKFCINSWDLKWCHWEIVGSQPLLWVHHDILRQGFSSCGIVTGASGYIMGLGTHTALPAPMSESPVDPSTGLPMCCNCFSNICKPRPVSRLQPRSGSWSFFQTF